jgi:hypothetical protein
MTWIRPNEHEIADRVSAMTEEERLSLPRIVNNNGRDYASCPSCKHYHAMMPHTAYPSNGGYFHFNFCRDCGLIGIVVGKGEL